MRQTKTQRLKAEIYALKQELRAHQERCKHPDHHLTYVLKGSWGNYDRTLDHYWAEYVCALCQAEWIQNGRHHHRGTRIQ